MNRILIAAALVSFLAAPAAAQDKKYSVVYDKSSKKCSVTLAPPTPTERFSMMGIYGSELEAKQAMKGMSECK